MESRADFRERISIHALLAESDGRGQVHVLPYWDFYPRSPCGERPYCIITKSCYNNFYPRSPCGERPRTGLTCGGGRIISIHALLAESDQQQHYKRVQRTNFYPRSPCGERPPATASAAQTTGFLSTLSLRRATTHPVTILVRVIISIHALLAESDALIAR